ncbi:hypothetical protein A6770_23250 [Nostoc minutum NIES-26]|uniref:Uncharacterized protein n=1 Tax=Nostoc minutum NIES-26 TaxID=1844469 RepID=A0A367QWD9_9NOSO|nr:hypothetical protein [Dendronalium sp. ChiSLP03b]MDZ8205618.1 hypothetical protein [Dendronalium sp. ChiSLP03b]RCJ28527.1 hypothetical protein A6770_23250 [Nostoc minutum NIES-26]
MNYYTDLMSELLWDLPANVPLLAQAIRDPDLIGQISKAWSHFVQTGQIWALLIGLVIGYIIRNLTSYG